MSSSKQFLVGCSTLVAVLSLALLPQANAQMTEQEFQMGQAREACTAAAQGRGFTVDSVVSTTPINSGGRMTGSEVVMSVSRQGQTDNLRCTYNNASSTATLSSVPNQNANQPNRPTPPTQPQRGTLQGRGVVQGSAFTRGRNANVTLLIEGENYNLEMTEPGSGPQARNRARVQYRGAITRRRDTGSRNSNSFVLDTRVRSFDSSDNLRVVTNTTGTCRIEVFDARVVSSSCRTAANNSNTEFLGLEQF